MIECRKDPKGTGSQYRFDPRQVSEAIEELILGGKIPPRKRASKTCPTCKGKGKIPAGPVVAETRDVLRGSGLGDQGLEHIASVSIDTRRWNDVFDTLAG